MIRRRHGPLVLVLGSAAVLTLIGCGSAPLPSASAPVITPAPPNGSPDPRAEPTFQSTSQPTLQPSVLPSTLPATPPPSSADPVFANLLPHVPETIRASCLPGEALDPVIASISCSVGDGAVTLDYIQYPDRDSMYAAYNARVGIAEIEAESGLCYDGDGGSIRATPGRWPAERGYSIADIVTGRYLCLELDLPTIAWTDDRLNILTLATAATGDSDRLVAFWLNEAGPIP